VCLGSHRSKEVRKAAAASATTSACALFNGRRDGNELGFVVCLDEGLLEDVSDDDDEDKEDENEAGLPPREERDENDEEEEEKGEIDLGEEALDAEALAAAIALNGKRPRLAAWSR